jgi:hypothetical protein
MDRPALDTPEPIVHCCGCNRLITLKSGTVPGDTVSCPFCDTRMVLRELTVYVAEPLTEA